MDPQCSSTPSFRSLWVRIRSKTGQIRCHAPQAGGTELARRRSCLSPSWTRCVSTLLVEASLRLSAMVVWMFSIPISSACTPILIGLLLTTCVFYFHVPFAIDLCVIHFALHCLLAVASSCSDVKDVGYVIVSILFS